jgi:hypothetical protein
MCILLYFCNFSCQHGSSPRQLYSMSRVGTKNQGYFPEQGMSPQRRQSLPEIHLRSMISPTVTHKPHFGNIVTPRTVTATGTSVLQGSAALTTKLKHWHCRLKNEHPSHSHAGPQQQQGRHPAPHLQQNSKLRQQNPAFPEHPVQSASL